MEKKELLEIIDKFKQKNILVIGDIILDKYIEGKVERISQEAPIPIISIDVEYFKLGGAANVAANIKSLSGNATLIGSIGKDEEGEKIIELTQEKGIKFFPEFNTQTTRKTRIISSNQQLLRIDREETLPKKFNSKTITDEASKADIIVISDYAKGTITPELMQVLEQFKQKILVDPKPKNKELYKEILLITPNKKEIFAMVREREIHEAGEKLKKDLNTKVIIKRANEGMSIFNDGVKDIPTYAKEVYDVSGAGDTVSAALALALATGASLEQAAIIANHTAGIVIGKHGTATATIQELKNQLLK